MQRSKPDRAQDVDAQTTLEDVFASRTFGKQLPDPLGRGSGSAMADAVGPRAAGIVKNRFVATVSVAAAVLSLAVVTVSTGTVKAPTFSAAHVGAPGPVNPDFSNPALSGSGTATGNGGGSAGAPAPAPTSPSPTGVPVLTTPGRVNGTVGTFTPRGNNSGTPALIAVTAKAPATVTAAPPPAPTTTTTAPPATTTTTTTPPQGGGGSTGDNHRGQWPPWGSTGPNATCANQSNAHVLQTCP
jgi:hypothetical protein